MGRPVRGWVGRLLAVGRCIQDAAALAPGRVGHPLEVGRCTRGAFCSRLGAVERVPSPASRSVSRAVSAWARTGHHLDQRTMIDCSSPTLSDLVEVRSIVKRPLNSRADHRITQ